MPQSSAIDRNVLLLLTDQERYDVSAPTGPAVDTESMDRLQAEGMRFDRAYTPISICSSARASLLTGLYPHNHGVLNNCHGADALQERLSPEHPTFGELLAEHGYDTTYFGKWHVGKDQTPEDFGFRYVGDDAREFGEDSTEFRRYQRRLGVDPDEIEIEDAIRIDYPDGSPVVAGRTTAPKEATLPYYAAERTIEQLRQHADSGEQFFHRTDFEGPHHPYVVPEPYASMYDPDEIDPWSNYADTFEGKPGAHEQFLTYRGVDEFDWDTWAEAVAKYFGFVTFIDDQIGRVLDAVDELGLAQDTAVVHAADHGDFTGSHRQFNKGPMMYEETYHVPLMVRCPDLVEPGTTCDEFVRLLDLMPTFLELGGRTPPADVDGRSILPLLRGETPPDWPESVFAEYHGEEFGLYSQRMVRTEEFKFVYNGPDVDELYDLRDDPDELNNLVDHPEYQDVRRTLAQKLADWMERTDDDIALWPSKILSA